MGEFLSASIGRKAIRSLVKGRADHPLCSSTPSWRMSVALSPVVVIAAILPARMPITSTTSSSIDLPVDGISPVGVRSGPSCVPGAARMKEVVGRYRSGAVAVQEVEQLLPSP